MPPALEMGARRLQRGKRPRGTTVLLPGAEQAQPWWHKGSGLCSCPASSSEDTSIVQTGTDAHHPQGEERWGFSPP